MHVHLMNTQERVEYFPLLFIANGVTGIRDMGAGLPLSRLREIRASIDRGEMMGPRIGAAAGTILEGREAAPGARSCSSRTRPRRGWPSTGTRATARISSRCTNGLSREAYLAIVVEAKREGLPVAGHIPASMSASELFDLGQRTIEHSGSVGSSPAELLMSCSSDEAALRKGWEELGPMLKSFHVK